MNFVFFGTPEYAAIIIGKLIDAGFVPVAVICNPDRPVGRKKILTAPPTKILAQKYNIPVWQPETLTTKNPAKNGALADPSVVQESGPGLGIRNNKHIVNSNSLSSGNVDNSISEPAEGFAPSGPGIPSPGPHYAAGSQDLLYQNWDFFVVAAYSKILPKEILDIPRLGTVGVHPSLLPKYRGPTPIQSAILAGEKETGVTLYLLDEKMDHGPILSNEKLVMSNEETTETLTKKLAELGADLLIKLLPLMEAPQLAGALEPQGESQATYTKKFKTEDAFVDLEKDSPIEIERKIRALNPEPGVFTLSPSKGGHRRMKILEVELTPEGKLKLKKIQYEGGKLIELS